ncbi:hypothetical protein ON021_10375, partial [Microcoleus sp. HI-ES]|nr:hypothetical protein [Microcoleus sp. HI-ES]
QHQSRSQYNQHECQQTVVAASWHQPQLQPHIAGKSLQFIRVHDRLWQCHAARMMGKEINQESELGKRSIFTV